jgi:hypothetical protein
MKKTTTASVTFFDGFATRNWRPAPFVWWFRSKEGDGNNVVPFLYSGGDVKKVMVARSFFFFFGPYGLVH